VSRSSEQPLATAAPTALLVLGILGFVPGVTARYGDLELAGRNSRAQLFGVFDVSILLLLVYVALGLLGLAAAQTHRSARRWLAGAGAVLAALWVFGLVVGRNDGANFLPVDTADTWLHFAFALVLLAAYVPHQNEAAITT
jgi:hypothetical protein